MRALVPIALLLLAFGGCDGCASPVAVLRGAEGTVEGRIGGSDWRAAAPGQELRVEDAVRTEAASSARVHLIGAGDLRLGAHTMLVFHPGRAEAYSTLLELEGGELVIDSDEGPIQLLTEFGELVLERNGQAHVVRQDGETQVRVAIGRATIERVGEESIDLGVLDTVVIGPDGEAVVQRAEEEPPDVEAATVAENRAEVEAAPTETVAITVLGRRVTVTRGEGEEAEALGSGETTLPRGAALDIPGGARVTASGAEGSVTARGRARVRIPREGLLSIDIGAAEIMSNGTPVRVGVPGGILRTASGMRAAASVEVSRQGTELSVEGGQLTVETASGAHDLRAGDSVRVSTEGEVTALDRAPTSADLQVAAGESATIHDARPPTTVRLTIAGCEETVTATVGVRRFEGEGGAIIPVRGVTRYEARCGDGAAVRGVLRTRRDNGHAPLLRSAPRTRVDADGRTYRVLYQNLLPEVEVRWRDAPDASGFRLELESTGGPRESRRRVINTPTARHTFESGELREGSHQFRFVGGGQTSAASTIVIAFDNAAPTVFVREPADGSLAAGASATVSGQLLEGFTASIGGTELAVDGQGRFSAEVTVPADGRSLAIRATHPSRGIHYYLRHPAGAER